MRATEKRVHLWLRDVCTSEHFADVSPYGVCTYYGASNVRGVRPCFNLYYVLITVSCNRAGFWLRDVCTPTNFADIDNYSACSTYHASTAVGVRPCFTLYIINHGLLRSARLFGYVIYAFPPISLMSTATVFMALVTRRAPVASAHVLNYIKKKDRVLYPSFT